MGKVKQDRRKTVGRNRVSRSKVEKPRKSEVVKLDGGNPEFFAGRILRKRPAPTPPPTLTAFEVAWCPHPSNAPNYICFRLQPEATFSQPVAPDRIVYEQYTRDQLSIVAGTDPGNLQFSTTRFVLDAYSVQNEEGDVATTGILTFQDNPGYTPNYLIDGTTNLHYTFGAYWRIVLDGTEVLNTSAHPIFAIAIGAHPRAFAPAVLYTANYSLVFNNWANAAPLATQWAVPPNPYPMPQDLDP